MRKQYEQHGVKLVISICPFLSLLLCLCVFLGCEEKNFDQGTKVIGQETKIDQAARQTRKARIIGVIDGETVRVEYDNGKKEKIHLLGVDAPEEDIEKLDTTNFEGVPDTKKARKCLREWGEDARSTLLILSGDKSATLVFDSLYEKEEKSKKQAAYVITDKDERNLNLHLIKIGLARITDVIHSKLPEFSKAETKAMNQLEKIWNCSCCGTQEYNPPVKVREVEENESSK